MRWTLFVASRYFNTKRKDKNLASSILSVVGTAVGTMTLITVLAVMNGFQIGFIEDILEISSFHIRIPLEKPEVDQEELESIKNIRGIKSVLPVLETQTMIITDFSGFQPCIIRGVPANFTQYDPGLAEQLNISTADKNSIGEDEILIGIELANHLGVTVGEEIKIISLGGDNFSTIKPEQMKFRIIGLFKSGYYEFDRGMGFINIKSAMGIAANNDQLILGVKLDNRYHDRSVVAKINSIGLQLPEKGKIISWREYNSSFFGALRMEKIAMMILIGLIFIVVGGNIYQSLKRTVLEKIEEISLLKSIGASGKSIRRVFIVDGIFIGLLGGLSGLILGLLIAFNINTIFSVFEKISNAVLLIIAQIINPIVGAGLEEISVFSPRYYYMTEVPVQLPYIEALLIFLFALLSATAAAYFASKKITTIKPSEVLRYE